MAFRGKRSGTIHNFTTDVDLGYKYIEKFRGGVEWYTMESKKIISSLCFKIKNETSQLVSFNGQSITFRISIKEIWFLNIWYFIFTHNQVLIIIIFVWIRNLIFNYKLLK